MRTILSVIAVLVSLGGFAFAGVIPQRVTAEPDLEALLRAFTRQTIVEMRPQSQRCLPTRGC